MARIAFLTDKEFDGASIRQASAGGIKIGTTQLAEALARRGHDVEVYSLTAEAFELNGVRWRPFGEAPSARPDLVVSNNNLDHFARLARAERVLWSRNPIAASKIWKKNLLWQCLRFRPHAVFLSRYHLDSTPGPLPFKSRRIIEHGAQAMFRRTDAAAAAPPPRALFTSQPYRGLRWLVDVWMTLIRPRAPDAELHVFSPKGDPSLAFLKDADAPGLVLRGGLPQPELAIELRAGRILLCPGHRDETYCNAAAEATASGLPIVTRGFGSLAERVRDGETGFVAREPEEFAARAVALLTDDALWMRQHRAALADPRLKSWDERAAEWEAAFL